MHLVAVVLSFGKKIISVVGQFVSVRSSFVPATRALFGIRSKTVHLKFFGIVRSSLK